MLKLRFRFEKTGRAVYMSHLDLMRTFQRAFARAEAPIRFSEGFNPHPKISIVAPLSLGTASVCELLDAEMDAESVPADAIDRLNAALPSGIRVLSCAEPVCKPGELAWIEHELRLIYDEPRASGGDIEKLFSSENLVISKKTKRGESETDILPLIKDLAVRQDGRDVVITAKLAFGESVLGAAYLRAAVERYLPQATPDFAEYRRIETYKKDFSLFR